MDNDALLWAQIAVREASCLIASRLLHLLRQGQGIEIEQLYHFLTLSLGMRRLLDVEEARLEAV